MMNEHEYFSVFQGGRMKSTLQILIVTILGFIALFFLDGLERGMVLGFLGPSLVPGWLAIIAVAVSMAPNAPRPAFRTGQSNPRLTPLAGRCLALFNSADCAISKKSP